MYRIPQEVKNEIVATYQRSPVSICALEKKFGVCQPKISQIIKESGIPIWPKGLINNPSLKESYFGRIDSEAKAYFLGLLCTDGCIFIPKTGGKSSASITLKDSDAYILERFLRELNSCRKVSFDKRGMATATVVSDVLSGDLQRHGVLVGKENRTSLPVVSQDLMHHMLRGMFDGDGSFTSHVEKSRKHRHRITICGVPALINEIQAHFEKVLGVLHTRPYLYSEQFGEVRWNRIEDLRKIGDYLYHDASLCLLRKQEVFKSFCRHYNL